MNTPFKNKQSIKNSFFKEAVFIIPEYTPEGIRLVKPLNKLETSILKNFVGYHVVSTETAYLHNTNDLQTDDALLYTVILQDTKVDLQRLVDIVKQCASEMQQTHIYFKKPSGEVVFLEVEPYEITFDAEDGS